MSFESLVLILGAEPQRAREVAPGHSRLSCAFLTSPMGLQRSQEAVLLGLARASVPNSLQVERGEPVWTWDAEALRVRELHLAVRLGLENSPGVEGAVGKVLCLSRSFFCPFCHPSAFLLGRVCSFLSPFAGRLMNSLV